MANKRVQATLYSAPDPRRSAIYTSLQSIDGPIRISGIDECVQPWRALPDGFDAGLSVPLPGEEPAELGEIPPQLAQWGRGRRRVTVVLHRIEGIPRLGFKDHLTGHLGIGTARHGDMVEPPGHDHINRQGIQSPLLRLHAQRFNLTPLLESPGKAFHCPSTAIPLHHGARPWKIRHREPRQQSPRHRVLALGWASLLGINCAERHWRPLASRPTGSSAGHGLGRDHEGDQSGRPFRLARLFDGEGPQSRGLRPLGP
jgi:hypothetical protein